MPSKYWVIIPAAGVGKRMQSNIPKQYLPLAGKKVIEYSIEAFLRHPQIHQIMVVISDSDEYWSKTLYANHPKVQQVKGGQERLFSVMNGLQKLHQIADQKDWVLVHDAARPCLNQKDITQLIAKTKNQPEGGLLAIPLTDTIKQQANQQLKTIPRETLWRAFTPQCFPIATLYKALQSAIKQKLKITDEASAMEYQGFNPILVKGSSQNIKITEPDDLVLAEFFLKI